MADAVDCEERPPEGHAPTVRDCYRPPTYSSETYPRFPQELIDRICEFLRLDPFTLTKCHLVCHAWYHAALRVSGWDSRLKLQTREALDSCARMLLSNGNRPFGKKFNALEIKEDPRQPFIRVFPMRLPGYVLPKVTSLWLYNFDYALTRPHYRFFYFLSQYTSVTTLYLMECCFCSIAEVRRISNALPSLEKLSLSVTLKHPLALNSVAHPSVRNRLKTISLFRVARNAFSPSGAHLHEYRHQFLSDVCATYSYVTKLDLDLSYCSSFSHLHWLLCQFPHLSCLELQHTFSSDVEPASVADMALYSTHAPNPSMLDFELYDVPVSWASQLTKLVLTPQACSKLGPGALRFIIFDRHANDYALAELASCVTEVLRLAGAGLRKFVWSAVYVAHADSMRDVVPRLTANTLLTNLSMSIRWNNPSLSMIQRGLGTLLSDIQSPHLEHFSIRIDLYPETSEDGDKASLSETDPPGSTSAFHTKLSRSVFDQLPGFSMPGRHSEFTGVYIAVEMREAETATMSAIKSHMITLFAPWLDRGVLRLSISPNPDGEQFVTRNPSSVHSDLGPHASIVEILHDSEDDEHEGGARDATGSGVSTETEDAISPQPTARAELRD